METSLPRSRLLGHAFVLSTPVGLACLVLTALDWMSGPAGVAVWLVAALGGAALQWRPLRDRALIGRGSRMNPSRHGACARVIRPTGSSRPA